jgi:glyoxylase-like metal-dependent hydrolase (beta-lactamase superfamily II)
MEVDSPHPHDDIYVVVGSSDPVINSLKSKNCTVKILREGYMNEPCGGIYRAACTITLIQGPGVNLLVDTGSAWDGGLLIHALNQHGLQPFDIDYVVCTHGHSDHVGNLNLFPHSVHIVGHDIHAQPGSIQKGNSNPNYINEEIGTKIRAQMPIPSHDHMLLHDFQQGIPYDVVENKLQVIATPGHTFNSVSIIVKDVENVGTIAIVGDLFMKENDLIREDLWQRFSENVEIQESQRRRILSKVDYIVPGHGPMFKVLDEHRKHPSIEDLS